MGQKCPESPERLLKRKLSDTFVFFFPALLSASYHPLVFKKKLLKLQNQDTETKSE